MGKRERWNKWAIQKIKRIWNKEKGREEIAHKGEKLDAWETERRGRGSR